MNWLDEIEQELRRSIPKENPGRTRTIARRAAGMAANALYKTSEQNFLTILARMVIDEHIPTEVREAGKRLCARVSIDFISPSIDPLADAAIIINFVQQQIRKDQ